MVLQVNYIVLLCQVRTFPLRHMGFNLPCHPWNHIYRAGPFGPLPFFVTLLSFIYKAGIPVNWNASTV